MVQVAKTAVKQQKPWPLLDFLHDTWQQSRSCQRKDAFQAAGLTGHDATKFHLSGIGKLADHLHCHCKQPRASQFTGCVFDTIGQLTMQALPDRSSKSCLELAELQLHCCLQLELLWTLNWVLYLLGIL